MFSIAVVAELVAVFLLVNDGRRARRALDAYAKVANPESPNDGTWAQVLELPQVVKTVLDNQIQRRWAITLILVGIVTGFLGNMTGLHRA